MQHFWLKSHVYFGENIWNHQVWWLLSSLFKCVAARLHCNCMQAIVAKTSLFEPALSRHWRTHWPAFLLLTSLILELCSSSNVQNTKYFCYKSFVPLGLFPYSLGWIFLNRPSFFFFLTLILLLRYYTNVVNLRKMQFLDLCRAHLREINLSNTVLEISLGELIPIPNPDLCRMSPTRFMIII